MNMFRGKVVTKQVFPFPETLSKDDTDLIREMVDPVNDFMNVSFTFLEISIFKSFFRNVIKKQLTTTVASSSSFYFFPLHFRNN